MSQKKKLWPRTEIGTFRPIASSDIFSILRDYLNSLHSVTMKNNYSLILIKDYPSFKIYIKIILYVSCFNAKDGCST